MDHRGKIDAAWRVQKLAIDIQSGREFSTERRSVYRQRKIAGSLALKLTKRDWQQRLQHAHGGLAAHPHTVFVTAFQQVEQCIFFQCFIRFAARRL